MTAATPSPDGRRRRSEQSRDRIITAMIELVEGGAITPSAEDVAARAAVGLRSVFRHFRDMESLYHEMSVRISSQYRMWLVPFESPDWRGQLDETIDRRLTTYERLMPFKRAADAHRHESPSMQADYLATLRMMRTRLESVLPADCGPDRLEAVDLLLSFEVWQRLRSEQALPESEARQVIERQITRALSELAG